MVRIHPSLSGKQPTSQPKYRSAATTMPLEQAKTPYSTVRSDTLTIDRHNLRRITNSLPFESIANGRFSDSDIARASSQAGPVQWQKQAFDQSLVYNESANKWERMDKIVERNYALAATTPVLGQYAPTFGWPDDWGWYWEYMDAYLFVPEVAFATKLKTRQVWKPGYEFDSGSDKTNEKILREWKRLKIGHNLFEANKNGFIWGNEYMAIQDNGDAVFSDSTPADYAQGSGFSNITGAPRPLVKFTPPTKFYGLMNTDPRTFRIQVHPQRWAV